MAREGTGGSLLSEVPCGTCGGSNNRGFVFPERASEAGTVLYRRYRESGWSPRVVGVVSPWDSITANTTLN